MKDNTVGEMTASEPVARGLERHELERIDEVLILLHQQRRYARTEDEAMELSRAHETVAGIRNRIAREGVQNSVLQPWVTTLGLRHQGVLVSAVRGCDTDAKDGVTKGLTRCLRSVILRAHVGDPKKAATFIEVVGVDVLCQRMRDVLNNHDHLPHHWFMHFVHAAQVIGYCHPSRDTAELWLSFYIRACHKLHVGPETASAMDLRLNADELAFKHAQDV